MSYRVHIFFPAAAIAGSVFTDGVFEQSIAGRVSMRGRRRAKHVAGTPSSGSARSAKICYARPASKRGADVV